MKSSILVFGASGHASYTIDIIEQQGIYEIAGVIDQNLPKGSKFCGYEVFGSIKSLKKIVANHNIFGGIIGIGDAVTRCLVAQEIKELVPSFNFVTAIHPSAIIGKDVIIGEGSLIMAGTIITNNATLGKHTFIATKASIAHHNIIGDFSSVNPGATLGGTVITGKCVTIGLSANVINNINIGDYAVIGAASLVTKNIPDNIVAYGTPAKFVRYHKTTFRKLHVVEV